MRQIYWNEYSNGSEGENERYTISVDPDAKSTFPGAGAAAYSISTVRESIERVSAWRDPATTLEKGQSLLKDDGYFTRQANTTETYVDSDSRISPSNDPGSYRPHYATFPYAND